MIELVDGRELIQNRR